MARKKGLGKGLEALFEDNSTAVSQGAELVKISEIQPNKNQPRRDFDQEALETLADSIREHGVLQPLILRPVSTGGYQIVAGERRYRASRMAGLNEVPAIIRELNDTETMEIALIENLQREDLNPVEEALGYQELMERYDFTQEEVSRSVGKSRPAVANALRLLHLPEPVLKLVREGSLSSGHARAILSAGEPERMNQLAEKTVREGLNVRAVEKLAKKQPKPEPEKRAQQFVAEHKFYEEMKLALEEALGRRVNIEAGKQKSRLVIEFYDEADLAGLAERLTGEAAKE